MIRLIKNVDGSVTSVVWWQLKSDTSRKYVVPMDMYLVLLKGSKNESEFRASLFASGIGIMLDVSEEDKQELNSYGNALIPMDKYDALTKKMKKEEVMLREAMAGSKE